MKSINQSEAVIVDSALLRAWPLPEHAGDGDKETRGSVVIIAGCSEMPGALILAANAALRAGAGKIALATGASVARLVAATIPEARVVSLPERDAQNAPAGFDAAALPILQELIAHADAVLIGPGMSEALANCVPMRQLLQGLRGLQNNAHRIKLILDAGAMGLIESIFESTDVTSGVTSHVISDAASHVTSDAAPHSADALQVLLTPHAGEMAHLLRLDKATIQAKPAEHALQAAARWHACIALKGACTFIATATQLWRHEGGNIGLAVSGSGDTLAGIMVGLAARGASLEQAAVWGVALHARAGAALAERIGPLGYLAREIPDEVPRLMERLKTI